MNNFLNNLDYLLKKNHMNRSELARALNMPPSTINSWFNRSCDGVALKSLIDISNYFNVSLDVLVSSEDIEVDLQKERKDKETVKQFTDDEAARLKRLLAYYEAFTKPN